MLTDDATAILAVDPGAHSGWAIITTRPIDWGVVTLKNANAIEVLMLIASKAQLTGVKTMVIEGPYRLRLPKPKPQEGQEQDIDRDAIGWRTYFGMGVSRGYWDMLARMHHWAVVEVNPRTWQAATIGTHPRAQMAELYRATAKTLTHSPAQIPADAAAAICIGDWYAMKQRLRPPWERDPK